MNPTLAHLRLDRLTVIRMLGSNAPMVLSPQHGQHESTAISYEEQQARARALAQNEKFIIGLAIEGTDQHLIAALLSVSRQTIQKRLHPHGIARQVTGPGTWQRANRWSDRELAVEAGRKGGHVRAQKALLTP